MKLEDINDPRLRERILAAVRDQYSGKAPKLEPDPRHEPLEKGQVQKDPRQRFLVIVTSFRKRLLDEDNLCEKYHVDLLRYAGILPTDAPGTTKIEVRQEKSKNEHTHIQVITYE